MHLVGIITKVFNRIKCVKLCRPVVYTGIHTRRIARIKVNVDVSNSLKEK